MKTIIFIILITLMSSKVIGQSNEFSIHLNSGLFSYGGSSAVNTTFVNISDVNNIASYTNNPYGRKSSFSYGLAFQAQRLTKANYLFGIQIGYEILSSLVHLDNAYGEINWSVIDGNTIFKSQFINFQPFIGKRFNPIINITTDLTFGFDYGMCLKREEHITINTDQGDELNLTHKRNDKVLDFRPRIEFINYFKRFGLSLGYSYGLSNYEGNMVGANNKVFSRMIRIGLVYKI